MIFEELREFAWNEPERLFLQDTRVALTAREVFELSQEMAQSMQRLNVPRIYFYATNCAYLGVCLFAAECVGLETCVLNKSLRQEEIEAILSRLGQGAVVTDVPLSLSSSRVLDWAELTNTTGHERKIGDTRSTDASSIVILTTGTTGLPKAARHHWKELLARVHQSKTSTGQTWLLAYPLNHFAGIQVLLHALKNRDSIVIPAERDYEQVVKLIAESKVDSVSGTPTFWRMILGRMTAARCGQLHLRQITLGGEAATPELLERLKSRFPSASIVQVYATTELGTCFSVKDGSPGFPASYIERPVGNVQLKIVEGELHVLSSAKMQGYADGNVLSQSQEGWIATGDMVEVNGGRVLFRGRKSEIINVGGVKVHPSKVEEAVLRVPGISAARAYGRPNPISGQIVACDIELESDAQEEAVRAEVLKKCTAELSRYELPRQLSVVTRLERQNEKLIRRA